MGRCRRTGVGEHHLSGSRSCGLRSLSSGSRLGSAARKMVRTGLWAGSAAADNEGRVSEVEDGHAPPKGLGREESTHCVGWAAIRRGERR